MSCPYAEQTDIAAFVVDPDEPRFREFRQHYPTCGDCFAAVREWSELAADLRSSGDAGIHLEPDTLARFARSSEALPAAERSAVVEHVRRCRTCDEEVRSLQRFDFARLRQREREGSRAEDRTPWFARVREWLAVPARLAWQPSVAYALVLLLAVPQVVQLVRERGDGEVRHSLREPGSRAAFPAPRAQRGPELVPLAAGERPRVALTGAGVVVSVPVLGAFADAAAVEVQIEFPSGDRQLRERFSSPGTEQRLEVLVPDAWLRSGSYTVEVFRAGDQQPSATFGFVVD